MTLFTKLDCNSGFHQETLDDSAQELNDVHYPIWMFLFQAAGPEVFHHIMSQLLSNIHGVICDINDILVSGYTQHEHDQGLM